MDPQAAWNQLQEAYPQGAGETARELAQSLLDWLARGGFPPVTGVENQGDPAQQRTAVMQFCRSVLQEVVDTQSP